MKARNEPAMLSVSALETIVGHREWSAVQCDGDYWLTNAGWDVLVISDLQRLMANAEDTRQRIAKEVMDSHGRQGQ